MVSHTTWSCFFIALSIIVIILIYFISRDEYKGRFVELQRLDVNLTPNPGFFKYVWPLFLLIASVGLLIASINNPDEGIFMRWFFILALILLIAYLLFGNDTFRWWPLCIGFFLLLVVLLGETIYHIGVTLGDKTAASLMIFLFLWAIFGLFITTLTSVRLVTDQELLRDNM